MIRPTVPGAVPRAAKAARLEEGKDEADPRPPEPTLQDLALIAAKQGMTVREFREEYL